MKNSLITTFLLLVTAIAAAAQGNPAIPDDQVHGYFYAHRSAHGGWPAFATSPDAIHFHDLLCGDSIFSADDKGPRGSVQYVQVCRTHDGSGFLMLTTEDDGTAYLQSSADLISWKVVPGIGFSGARSARIIWNAAAGEYMLYYAGTADGNVHARSLSAALDRMGNPVLLADWAADVRDAEIVWLGREAGGYRLLAKLSDGSRGFVSSASQALAGPWAEPETSFAVEGEDMCSSISAFKVAGQKGWSLGYVNETTGGYRLCQADDAMDRFYAPKNIEGTYGPDAGSFLALTKEEYERLQRWSDAAEPRHLAANVKNPVFPGLHADPEVLYSKKTGKYYIYPTTDGAYAWHSFDFHCFSSPDLKTWTDEGVILDLRDLSWGDREYAWAPCIIEKPVYRDAARTRIKGYKYYFYFVHHGTIGVAVADRPEGPFKDVLGKALLTQEEINAPNQIIDPDVFQDPVSGKYYLYWGNSYLWMAELADDMISLVPGTMHELIPRSRIGEYHYLEGSYVFERNGLYYFMWSENITRSSYYRVRYLISDSPTELVRGGRPAKVEEQIVIQQDPSLQIFGTGHHSVINIPGTDRWYIVYHRFNRPGGVKLGLSGGYNREVCIDPLEFNPDGTIRPVHPSL